MREAKLCFAELESMVHAVREKGIEVRFSEFARRPPLLLAIGKGRCDLQGNHILSVVRDRIVRNIYDLAASCRIPIVTKQRNNCVFASAPQNLLDSQYSGGEQTTNYR